MKENKKTLKPEKLKPEQISKTFLLISRL